MNFDLTEEIVSMQDMARKFGQRYETRTFAGFCFIWPC
jgi:hypothetical protein